MRDSKSLLTVRPTGKVNVMGLAIALAFFGAVYWGIVMGPVHLENLDIREWVTGTFNESARVPADALISPLLNKLNDAKFASHYETDENGLKIKVGGLGLSEDNITIERNEEAQTSTVRVEYVREVKMIPFEKYRNVKFVVQKSGAWAAP